MTSSSEPSGGRYRTVLFDFDHTLFDSTRSEQEAFGFAMAEMGVAQPSSYLDRYRSLNLSMWKAAERGELTVVDVGEQRFHRFVDEVGLDVDPVALRARYEQGMAQFGELYNGAIELLDRTAASARLGLVTNALSPIQRARIERTGIGHYFESIVISSEVGVTKPDAAIFAVAFGHLGLDPDDLPTKAETIMIGDSLSSDIRGGANAGVDTCWFNPSSTNEPPSERSGQAVPTYTVATLTEVGAVLGH